MLKVECIGMVGRYPTPDGEMTFYDTGRFVAPEDLAEALALQHSAFAVTGRQRRKVVREITRLLMKITRKVNVYPVGKAALADDGRILVSEPWFESKNQQK